MLDPTRLCINSFYVLQVFHNTGLLLKILYTSCLSAFLWDCLA